jgi:hypothetical protein
MRFLFSAPRAAAQPASSALNVAETLLGVVGTGLKFPFLPTSITALDLTAAMRQPSCRLICGAAARPCLSSHSCDYVTLQLSLQSCRSRNAV